MSLAVEASRFSARRRSGSSALASNWRSKLSLLPVVLTAVVLRLLVTTATDVSWLITVSEKLLDGSRLYVDLIELNPPASVLIYLPAVALSRLIGLAPEIVVNVLVFLAAGASLWIAGRILARARLLGGVDGWTLTAFAAFLLLVFPARTFAQREHIAVIVLLPALAVYVARAQNAFPGLFAAIAAGIGIGIGVSIKPHFALAVILAGGTAAYLARSWRTLFAPEHWIAGLIVAAYAGSVFVLYPQFLSDVLPLVQTVYVPVRLDWLTILTHTPTVLWLLSIFIVARQKRGAIVEPRFSILLMASCGFALAYALQGKGWPYHTYPMLALSLLAVAILPCERAENSPKKNTPAPSNFDRLATLAMSVALVVAGFYWMSLAVNFTSLVEIIRRNTIEPKMVAISSDIGLGHPLVRQVGGKWVQRVGSLWVSENVEMLLRVQGPAAAAALQRYAALDRAMLIEDIRREKPDIILLDQDREAKSRADAALSELLRPYGEIGRAEGVIILQRNGRSQR